MPDSIELRRSGDLELQAAALDASANGIVIVGSDGRIIWCNPAVTALSGYSKAELVGQTPRLFKSGRQDPDFYAKMWATVLSGRVWRGDVVNRRIEASEAEIAIEPGLPGLVATREYPGTGMGLAIVEGAVRRMNGNISLDSKPGRGSRFWIELPGAGGALQ